MGSSYPSFALGWVCDCRVSLGPWAFFFSLFPMYHQEVNDSLEANKTPQVVMTYRHSFTYVDRDQNGSLALPRKWEDRLPLFHSLRESGAVWERLDGGLRFLWEDLFRWLLRQGSNCGTAEWISREALTQGQTFSHKAEEPWTPTAAGEHSSTWAAFSGVRAAASTTGWVTLIAEVWKPCQH